MLRWAISQATACDFVGHIVIVVPPTHLAAARALLAEGEEEVVDIVAGGADRTASVARGLEMLRPDDGVVLVHDAARPLAPPNLFAAVVEAVRGGHGAVVPGLPPVDTVKQIDALGHVVATPDRSSLRAIQTPQGFVREILTHAHGRAGAVAATDDAAMVEATGAPVFVVAGDPLAFKVTTADDLAYAEWLIARRGGLPATSSAPGENGVAAPARPSGGT